MSADQTRYKRKQLIINKNFQMKFIFKAVIPLLIFIVLAAIGAVLILNRIEADFRFESTHELISMLSEKMGNLWQSSAEMFSSFRTLSLVFLGVFLLIGTGYVIYVFLYFSHRIAGPVLRFERALAEILKGNLKVQIVLRKNDEFQETAESFNEMITTLRDRIRRIDQFNRYTRETIAEMKSVASEENRTNFEKLEDLSRGIEEAIHEFDFRAD